MNPRTALIVAMPLMATLTGCNLLNPEDRHEALDGSAGVVTSEMSAMGAAVEDLLSGQGLSKMVADTDTVTIDVVITPWTYEQSLGAWTRASEAAFTGGMRVRKDTIWFYDASNAAIHTPTLATIARYRHVRTVTRTVNNTFAFHYDMNVSVEKSATDTVFVFNGDAEGTFNGTHFRSTNVADVQRLWNRNNRPRLGIPTSGTITMDRPLRTITVVFGGENTATATSTRKRDGDTVVYIVNVQNGDESGQ